MMDIRDLPTLNAVLNSAAAVMLFSGWIWIRRGSRDRHRTAMLAALACSALFLGSYLVYHYHAGSTRYAGEGMLRTLYFSILLSHTVLAASLVVLVPITVVRAWRGNFSRHRAIARWTWPVWIYVSVTGVVIYGMLYLNWGR